MPRHLWQELKTAIIPRHHTCPKDLASYRNISNILEEAPYLLDKLEFGEPQASQIPIPHALA